MKEISDKFSMLTNQPSRSPQLEVDEPSTFKTTPFTNTLCRPTSSSHLFSSSTNHCSTTTTTILHTSYPSSHIYTSTPIQVILRLSTPPPWSYSAPTKTSKVELLKFDGTNFWGWAYCCRQFFDVDVTPIDQRVHLLSIHLEKHALCWHLSFTKPRHLEEL